MVVKEFKVVLAIPSYVKDDISADFISEWIKHGVDSDALMHCANEVVEVKNDKKGNK